MKCGTTDLCDVEEIKGKYQVTWGRHLTSLKVYSEKVYILFDLILKDSRSMDVGILLTSGMVLWVSHSLLTTMKTGDLVDFTVKVGSVKSHDEIAGAIFDNIDDVETFVDRLEKKYIVYLLKR